MGMKLTQRTIAILTLPEGKDDHIVFDDAVVGLGLRVRKTGSRTWVYQYRFGPKQRRIALGDVAAIPLAKAREIAGTLQAQVRLGRDPTAEKAENRVRAAETFGSVLRPFLARQKARLRHASYSEVERHLVLHSKPLHALPINAIDRRAIAARLNEIAANSGPVAANRVRSSLSAFFSWAIREGLVDANPTIDTNKQPEKSRARVLSAAELVAIWKACRDDDYGHILRLLMLTGQRADEIASLRPEEVHDEAIVLPPERVKNKRTHVVPLSEPAKAIIRKALRSDRSHLFGRDDTGFGGWTYAKRTLDARIAARTGKPLAHWTHHDIRRSVVTGMADIGIAPHVIEAVVNHVSGHKGGVAGVYNRSTYDREKRIAVDLWTDHLLAIVEGRESNIVQLKQA